MKLGPQHLSELREAGAPFDEKDATVADSMARRGFTPEEFVVAYRTHSALKGRYPDTEHYPRDMVETVAVGQRLHLGEKQQYRLARSRHGKNRSLTDAYNVDVVGEHRALVISGWVLVAAGVSLAVAGGAVWGAYENKECVQTGDIYEYESCRSDKEDYVKVVAAPLLAVGGAAISAGVPCLVIGTMRKKRWLEPGALDGPQAPAATTADSAPRRSGLVGVAPYLSRNAAGAGVVFGF